MKENKTRGFTLIELLAIIVILAIIAVITVPIILNVIDESKRGAAVDSAYGYKKAVNQYYLTETAKDFNFDLGDGVYTVNIDGTLSKGDELLDIDVSGNKPTKGWVEIENGEVKYFSLKIGDYVVSLTGESDDVVAEKNGEILETEEARQERERQEAIAKAKKDAQEQADAYVKALEQACSSSTLEGAKDVSELNDLVSFEDLPIKGWVQFGENCEVTDFSVKIDDYVVSYDEDGENDYQSKVTTGEPKNKPIPGTVIENVKYYDTSVINDETQITTVYFNPGQIASETNPTAVSAGKCDINAYNANTDKLGKTGCMKWYAYSEFTDENGNTYVNMLLDHNTTLTTDGWISSSHWTTPPTNTGIEYPVGTTFNSDSYGSNGNNKMGPLTVLYQLHTDTDGWNLPIRNDQYTPASNSYSNYTIDYSAKKDGNTGYKARLISAEEIARITKKNTPTSPNGWKLSDSYFYFDTLTSSRNNSINSQNASAYAWLFTNLTGCESYGCKTNESTAPSGKNVYGYWSSFPYAGNSLSAWSVGYNGSLSNRYVSDTTRGVRPVITVLASDVF